MRRLLDTIRARFRGLRCRPGDLAIVVRGRDHPQFPGVVILKPGTVVRVTRISQRGLWVIESLIPFRFTVGTLFAIGSISEIADELLIPLRDKPGEDETLLAKPIERHPAVRSMPRQVEKVG